MEISLNLEKTASTDITIVIDVLRASTSITVAMNKFKKVIPCFTSEEAKKIEKYKNGVLAGECLGVKINGFDIGNSPVDIKNTNYESDTLILTTSNGTRILKNINSNVVIGCFINAEAAAKAGLKIAKKNDFSHIDIVMAGWKGKFAIEDFLASGEIIYWIQKELEKNNRNDFDFRISEYAQSAILASRDYNAAKKLIYMARSSKNLIELGYKKDVDYSLQKNISENVAISENGVLKLLK